MAPAYSLRITRPAQKELGALPKDDYIRVKKTILSLATEPRPDGCRKLKGRDAYRVRCGDYRVIYEIHKGELVVLVVRVAHSKEAYR